MPELDEPGRRGDAEPPPGPSGSSAAPLRRRWVRQTIGIVVVVVLAVEVYLVWPSLAAALEKLGNINYWWVLAAVAAEAASLSSFARLQKGLLNAAEVPVRQSQSLAVVYAANAMSVTLPGGPIFSTTFTFRRSRHWGASRLVASWQLLMSGVLSTGMLALLGVGAALTVGGTANPVGLTVAVALGLVLVLGIRFVARNPDSLDAVGRSVLRRVNRMRNRPRDAGLQRWIGGLRDLETVQLGARSGGLALAWAAWNWVADVATLWFACLAAGAHPSLSGLVIAYAAGKAVATVPLLPGGIGIVEATLTAALVAGGLPASTALAGVIVYRIISFFLVAVVGWGVFALLFRGRNTDHPDDVLNDSATTGI